MASGRNASVLGFVACFFHASACGGSIFLGSNDPASDNRAQDGGMVAATDAEPAANPSSGDGGVGEDANAGFVTALATDQFSPTSITVDANNVYWVNEGMPGQAAAAPCTTCTSGSGSGDASRRPFGPVQILKCAKSGCNDRPTVLVSDVTDSGDGSRLRGLVVDGTNVYWASANAVFACAITGCNNNPAIVHHVVLGIGDWPGLPSEISAIDQTVYGGEVGAVFSNSVSASSETRLFSRSGSWWWVAVDGTSVYAGNYPFGEPSGFGGSVFEISSCALSGCGGSPTILVSAPPQYPLVAALLGQLVVDDANVYWGQGQLPSWNASANGFAAHCGQTGWLPTGQMLECAKRGCNSSPTVLVDGLNCPIGMTTDGAYVYFTEPQYFGPGNPIAAVDDANNGRIAKCAVSGCSTQATTLVSKVNNPRGIAVDESYIYWTDFGSGGTVSAMSPTNRVYSNDGRVMMMAK